MENAAFKATFHTFKNVMGRKVVQLIFEVPVEESPRALDIVDYSKPDTDRWFAIARLGGHHE